MGSFSTDRTAIINSLTSYTDVLRRRKDALMHVQTLNDELLERLVAGEWQDLCEVLDRRERACAVLTRIMAGTPEMSSVIESAKEAASDGGSESAARILGLDDDIRMILADVVEKQQKCEELLKSELEKTAELIRQSANKRQLNTAYGPANARPQARFLDGKH